MVDNPAQFSLKTMLLWTAAVAFWLGVVRAVDDGLLFLWLALWLGAIVFVRAVEGPKAAIKASVTISLTFGWFIALLIALKVAGAIKATAFLTLLLVLTFIAGFGVAVSAVVEIPFRIIEALDSSAASPEDEEQS